MEKIVKIGNTEVRLDNSVAWTMEYKDQFGKDILPVIMPFVTSALEGIATVAADADELTMRGIAESLEGRAMDVLLPMFQADFVDLVVNVAWAMAKAADESIEPPKQWVRQFDSFPLDEIVPEIFGMAFKGFASSKNLERLKTIGENLKNLQPLNLTTSSSQDSNEG